MLLSNHKIFQDRLQKIITANGRDAKSIKTLLATKTVSVDRLLEVFDLGYTYFGENRVQELLEKQKSLSAKAITWDFIGHLQTNKVKDIVGRVNLIHSVDRLHLAQEIQKQAAKQNVTQNILLEVNTSSEESKSGVSPSELSDLATGILFMPNVKICGLMTIATNTDNKEEVERCFKDLYQLRITLAKILKVDMTSLELSMGMSGDFEEAIQEGATLIRVGSLLFGERKT